MILHQHWHNNLDTLHYIWHFVLRNDEKLSFLPENYQNFQADIDAHSIIYYWAYFCFNGRKFKNINKM